MPGKFVWVVGAALLAAMAVTADAQVISHRDTGSHMALKMIAAAVAKCEQNGGGLTVAVVDRQGQLRALLVADNASPHHVELAERKAYTALTSRRTSADWAKSTEPGSRTAGQRTMAKVVPLAGGIPIKVGDETIGAIGVSGSMSDPDETCAMAGVASVTDQLK